MNNIRHCRNHSRSGFLLLMLIAFASILLGLATTFYYYTSRGMDDSQMAVRLAQQRLALSGALNYITGKPTTPTLLIPFAAGTFYPPSGDNNAVPMALTSIQRTQRMGWFRVAQANASYLAADPTWSAAGYNGGNSVFITAGTGPSSGKILTPNAKEWSLELRSWYLVQLELDASVPPKYKVKKMVSVFPPPADYSVSPPSIIYY